MVNKSIDRVTLEIITLLNKHNMLIYMGITNVETFIYNDDLNTITIETDCITTYNEESEFTLVQLDKFLREFIYTCVEGSEQYNLKFISDKQDL